MEQRRLRLGDIIDDYCPRERRLTNHAVVAIVGDEVKQTRCSTCDAEHVYKQARVPARKKKAEGAATPVRPPADGRPAAEAADAAETPSMMPPGERVDAHEPALAAPSAVPVITMAAAHEAPAAPAEDPAGEPSPPADTGNAPQDDYWPAHRRLIRATLPRTVTDTPTPRQAPDFTLRLPGARLGPLRDTDFGFKSPVAPKGGKKNGRPGKKHQRGHAGASHTSHASQGRNGNVGGPPQGQHASHGRRGRHHGKPR
jgi:hypothetical protein